MSSNKAHLCSLKPVVNIGRSLMVKNQYKTSLNFTINIRLRYDVSVEVSVLNIPVGKQELTKLHQYHYTGRRQMQRYNGEGQVEIHRKSLIKYGSQRNMKREGRSTNSNVVSPSCQSIFGKNSEYLRSIKDQDNIQNQPCLMEKYLLSETVTQRL